MLKKRALQATIWSGADLILRQGTQFLTMVILARLLLPADFGVIAMLSLPMGIAALLTDGGLSSVLIQRKHITDAHTSSAFYFNIVAGITATACIFTAAPYLAKLLQAAELVAPMRIAAFTCLFTALSPVHSALLTRNLQFSTLAKASAFASIGSALIAILLAMNGAGVNALALHSVSMAALTTSALWWSSPWRPNSRFDWSTFRTMYTFGAYNIGASLLDTFYNRALAPVIGKAYGITQVGLYSQADIIRQLPSNFLSNTVSRVAFPLLSSLHSDSPDIPRRALQLSIRVTTLLNAPLALGMAASSDLLVTTLLGSHWLPAGPVLAILCIANLVQPMNSLNVQTLLAQGQVKYLFRIELAKKTLGFILLVSSIPFGLEMIAWSQVALAILSLPINAIHQRCKLDYGIIPQLFDALPCIVIAAISAVITACAAAKLERAPGLLTLVISMGIMALSYFIMLTLFKVEAWKDTLSLLKAARSS